MLNGRKRVVIENVKPEVNGGAYPIKRVLGEEVTVEADIFADGHDLVAACVLYRRNSEADWREAPMTPLVNDRWTGTFVVDELVTYQYTVEGWLDHFSTWQRDLRKKVDAGQDVSVDLIVGAMLLEARIPLAGDPDGARLEAIATQLRNKAAPDKAKQAALSDELAEIMRAHPDRTTATTYDRQLAVTVDRVKALYSSWYEMFPRSMSQEPGRPGTLKDCLALLPDIADMGFDVLYLPPIHPIGQTNRKGRNNTPAAGPDDPGSPWAIGSSEGGHKSVDPALGNLDDFRALVAGARANEMEIALDIAFQCSPDHPYIKEHPEWFKLRPDGSIQFAENPPKKYEDIVPFDFESEAWRDLWLELKSIVTFWIDNGIRIFRVDNPHTKSFPFWEWLIGDIRKDNPDVIFLAEAFTRPKIKYRLAKLGFTQSYTYFTWRNTKEEITAYLTELTATDVREYFRPNFWPNTPDILAEYLQYGGRPAFITRLILAATLSSNYGIYGPAFEHHVAEAIPGKEEYQDSEKYEIKHWNSRTQGNLRDLITRVNRIRKENPALHESWNLRFYEVDNPYLLFFGKSTGDGENNILVVVNLDPFHVQSGWVQLPLEQLSMRTDQPYLVQDLLTEDTYIWQGPNNYVELNPAVMPVHIFRVHRRLRREVDFDYYM